MKIQDAFVAWVRRTGWPVLLIALLQLALHLWVAAHDTIFRDELYYIAAGRHLSPGYVEYPPFVALAAAFSGLVFGPTSLFGLRILPALAGVAVILLVADMVREMGGSRGAQILAALGIGFAPIFIANSGLLTMDPFDGLWWTLTAWLLVRMITRQQPRLWIALGVAIGVGLLTKLPIAFFVIALLIGLLLSGQRKLIFNRWPFIGAAIALVIVSPYLIWQAVHGFPVVEYTRLYSQGKVFAAGPLGFLLQQIITMNPLALPLWLGGLYFLFFTAAGRPYRAFAWAYVLLYIFFFLQTAKFYWLSPAYPMLFAGGACGLDLLVQKRPRLTWMQPAYIWTLLISGLLLTPFSMPLVSPETYVQASKSTGGVLQVQTENLTSSALPQGFADRFGWREMADTVKAAYDTLTPEEQAKACVIARNYGEAGAVAFYGPTLGMDVPVLSGHNSYYVWGPQGCTGEIMISLGYPVQDVANSFDSVEDAGAVSCQYCMPYENGIRVLILRGLKVPMQDAWPTTKMYN
jgi:4-amino-4-deoxy-L-arabinose transferase-like glycosyltransferase